MLGGGLSAGKEKKMLGRLLEKKMCWYTRENPLHLRPKKKRCVSGNPTLPSKTLRPCIEPPTSPHYELSVSF